MNIWNNGQGWLKVCTNFTPTYRIKLKSLVPKQSTSDKRTKKVNFETIKLKSPSPCKCRVQAQSKGSSQNYKGKSNFGPRSKCHEKNLISK